MDLDRVSHLPQEVLELRARLARRHKLCQGQVSARLLHSLDLGCQLKKGDEHLKLQLPFFRLVPGLILVDYGYHPCSAYGALSQKDLPPA